MGSLTLNYRPEDMSEAEIESLQDYIHNGCPGLIKATESDLFKWFGLYMAGKTYEEIAQLTGVRRDLVLYISYKSSWCEKRMNHYNDLIQNLSQKVSQTKLDSANTISTMITALNKYYGDKFNKFLASHDKSLLEKLDTKLLAQYNKSHDVLDKIIAQAQGKGEEKENPLVNINVKSGQVKQVDDNTLEITDDSVSTILKALVEAKNKQD